MTLKGLLGRVKQEAKTGRFSEELTNDLRNKVREDTPEGYLLFYILVRNRHPPKHGIYWINEIYKSHAAGRRTLIEAFRGATKTTMVTETFTAYRIGLEPRKSNLFVQANDDQARKHADNVAAIIESNPMWQVLFPNVVPDKQKGWSANGYWVKDSSVDEGQWQQLRDKDPTLVGAGYGASIVVGSHPSGVFAIDDINNDKNTESERLNAETNRVLTDTLLPMIEPDTWVVFSQTPWTKKDALALMKETGVWNSIKTPVMSPALEGDGEFIEIKNKQGVIVFSGWYNLTWPQKFNKELIATKYLESGQKGFARMYLLDLQAMEGLWLKSEWLHEYPYDSISQEWPLFMGVDYASTSDKLKQKDRDYCAIYWGALSPRGTLILLDGIRMKMSQAEAEQRIIALTQTFPRLQSIGIESIGKGEEFYELLMRAPIYMPLMPIPSHKGAARSKGGRFEKVLAPLFQRGSIMISDRNTPALKAFREEWLSWDGTGIGHDDTLDAVYMMTKAAEGHIALPRIQATDRTSPLFSDRRKQKVNPFTKFGKVNQ